MRRASSYSLLGPAFLLYLVADASAAQGQLDSLGAAIAMLAGGLSLVFASVLRHGEAERRGEGRVGALALVAACALVPVAAPNALSLVSELCGGLAAAGGAALIVDLALAVPDRMSGAKRARFWRGSNWALSLTAGLVGASAYMPAVSVFGEVFIAPSALAYAGYLQLALALWLALALRARRRRLGSGPEALASNAWAILGLLPAALAALALPAALALEALSDAAARLCAAAASVALVFGHVRLIDPRQRLGVGRATRSAVAAVLTLMLVIAAAIGLAPLWPRGELAFGAAIAALLLLAFALYRGLLELARAVLAPASGRLLVALDAAHRELATARDLHDVARVALSAARRAAGFESEPYLYLFDPEHEFRLDAASRPHAAERVPSWAITRALRERPGELLARAPLERQLTRMPVLRELCDALRAVDALCVLPLSQFGELEGALIVPSGGRRSALTLEEIDALYRFAAHLSGFVAVLASELRAARRAEQARLAAQAARIELATLERGLARQASELRALRAGGTFERFEPTRIAYSEPMRSVHDRVAALAERDTAVLFICERGLPLEPLARSLHTRSAHAAAPFVIAPCADVRAESGHAALFGDGDSFAGLFALAESGTLLLRDLPALSRDAQAELAARMRAPRDRAAGAPARVLASCLRDPDALVGEGALSAELRACFPVVVRVPPLRECAADIPSLLLLALDRSARALGKPVPGLEPAAQAQLLSHPWPANHDELNAVIELAVARARGSRVTRADLPSLGSSADVPSHAYDGRYDELERRVLQRALERTGGNKSEASRLLGLKRTTFLDKLRRHRLDEGQKPRSSQEAAN